MVERRRLRPHELAVVRVLEMSRFEMTTNEISQDSNMSWRTAKRTLERLHEEGIVSRHRRGRSIYWGL